VSERVAVIVNPASGRGRGAKMLSAVRRAFSEVGVNDVRVTEKKGDEARLCREAIDAGCSTIVACGGDGTWSNTATVILETGADCRLAVVATGTGNDFAKTLAIPAGNFQEMARLAVGGPDTHVDVGCIEKRYFLNVAGFGFDIAVLEQVETVNWLKGDALYLYCALRQLFGYRGITVDVAPRGPEPHLMLVIANGKNFGGAFRIAPGASVTDGLLDAVAIGAASPKRRISLFGAATKGTHVTKAEVRTTQASSFTLSFGTPPAYETDGEYNRASSATLEVRCVPGALRVVTPALT